ncbi:MAG TPA: hypothetical protein PLJ62_05960 [Thermoflexales bacterium]|nr:hypothetical protein [Thermoflexales bacterium]HQZ99720.1 hypothetical protein [Thermoflexales bacterium]
MWLKQNQKRISMAFGVMLILLAIIVPVIAPRAFRSDVLIMTLLFSIIGALMVYSAVSSKPMTQSTNDMREKLLRKHDHTWRNRIGLAFGMGITLAGIFAPFIFPGVGPDERFAMMLGFAPVAIAGGILVYVFYRAIKPAQKMETPAQNPSPKPPAPKRAPVARVQKNSALYAKIVPFAIAAMVVVIAAIVLFLIYIVAVAVLPLL